MAEISPQQMSYERHERAQVIANAIHEQIGETAVFAGDYTIVPIVGGVAVSKIFEGIGRPHYADVRVQDGVTWGKKIRPSGWKQLDWLSVTTSTRYLLGAAQTAGIELDIPEEHRMQVL
jgi:hypothetical protein